MRPKDKTAIVIKHPEGMSREALEKLVAKAIELEYDNLEVEEVESGGRHDLDWSLDDEAIAIWWHAEDIIDRAKDYENELNLTREQAVDILYSLKHGHDCCYGINWDTIDSYIDIEVQNQKD